MAAIDFPASPTNGQTFAAANGVTYTWNGTLWLASSGGAGAVSSDTPPSNPTANQLWFNSLLGQTFIWYNDGNTTQWVPATTDLSAPTSPGGDFFATGAGTAMSSTVTTLVPATIISGNTGSYYNSTNGRFTPPAGRYSVSGWIYLIGPASQSAVFVFLYKNGVLVTNVGPGMTTGPNFVGNTFFQATVDANGTDYFEMRGQSGGAGGTASAFGFSAFPISGIKGPPGDYPSGALYLYSEQVLAASATEMRVNFPAAAKRIELHYAAITSAHVGINLQGLIGSTPDAVAGHQILGHYQYYTTPTYPIIFYNAGQTFWGINGGTNLGGVVRFSMVNFPIDATNKMQAGVSESWALGGSGRTFQMLSIDKYDASVWTGYRLSVPTSTFLTPSFLRCYVVT